MTPKWIEQFDKSRKGKTRGYVLSGSTTDWVYYPESKTPPCPLKYFLASYLGREGYHVGTYSLANGFEELTRTNSNSNDKSNPFSRLPDNVTPDQALAFMTRWLRNKDAKVAIILDYADHIVPSSQGMTAVLDQSHLALLEVIHSWGVDETIRFTDNLVFLVSYEGQINDLLSHGGSGYISLSMELPNKEERKQFVELLTEVGDTESDVLKIGSDDLVRSTSGLPLVEIAEMLRYAEVTNTPLDQETVNDRKSCVIRQMCQGLLEVHEPTFGFESVSGLERAKEELGLLIQSVKVAPKTATQGVLLVGVPGCGKSHIVLALAKELGYPCLAMRNIRQALVGASEKNLETVLWVAETLSPCVMWMDEIDQVLGQRNTGQSMDAGTSERMMGRIWEFMGSMKHRGQILWIGTSNRPDVLDSALLDRFQMVIPFLHPTPSEVADLLPVLARQLGRELAEDVDTKEIGFIDNCQSPTVRALQEIVARAGSLTDLDTQVVGSPIDRIHILEAARDYKPNYNPVQHQFIALNAIKMTSFSSVLPWRNRQGLRDGAEFPHYVEGIVDKETGSVNQEALSRQLDLLGRTLQYEQSTRRF